MEDRCIGLVGGQLLHESADGQSVFTDEMYPIPLKGGKLIGISRESANPALLILQPEGTVEIVDASMGAHQIVIDDARPDLKGVIVTAVATTEQMIAVATPERVVVVTHSHKCCQPPTWLLIGRDKTTFLRFTPDRKRLLTGHASGRVNSVDIHMGLLSPIQHSNRVLVPAAADPQPSDRVVAAAALPDDQVLVLTPTQLQLWQPVDTKMEALAVKGPSGVGEFLDMVFLRRQLFVLCTHAVWHVCHRKRADRAKLFRADGARGWCIDVLGILVKRANSTRLRRIYV